MASPAKKRAKGPSAWVQLPRALVIACLVGLGMVVARTALAAGRLPAATHSMHTSEHTTRSGGLSYEEVAAVTALAAQPHVFTVQWDRHLEDLPGAAEVLGTKAPRSSVQLSLVSGLIQRVPAKAEEVEKGDHVAFGAMLLREDGSRGALPFGPTLRVRRGGALRVRLTNALPPDAAPPGGLLASLARAVQRLTRLDFTSEGNTFAGTRHTNLHMHGLHASPGLLEQPGEGGGMLGPENYTGGDNVFISIPQGGRVQYEHHLPKDHYPGMHWMHPHRHGSSSLQTAHASSVVIVEDDPAWLPDRAGCRAVRQLLATARERVLHLSMAHLALPTSLTKLGETDVVNLGRQVEDVDKPGADEDETFNTKFDLVGWLDQANELFLALLSEPPFHEFVGAAGATVGTDAEGLEDVVLVNGGFQPVIRMVPGVWQRWRMINTSFKRLLNLHILRMSGHPAPCQIMLLAKDGIYLMAMPRHLTSGSIYLSAGNRAEVLVKCDGKAGEEYTLSAGLGAVDLSDGALRPMRQRYVAVLRMLAANPAAAAAQPALEEEACRPLRPSYLSDLGDESLRAAGALRKVVHRPMAMREDVTLPSCNFNGRLFRFPEPHPIVFPIGSVVEINASFTRTHALHAHVSPFQIVRLPPESLVDTMAFTEYYREGDWHDVLSLPMTQTESAILLRVAPDKYGGYAVVHCHMLPHEDEGCMLLLKLECPAAAGANRQPLECPGYLPPVKGVTPHL
eukprot:scaffold14.g1187.t1